MLPFFSARQQLVLSAALLLICGFLLVTSASIHYADTRMHAPFYFSFRHGLFVLTALLLAWAVARFPIAYWQRLSPLLLLAGLGSLFVVLLPGIGREVNGSQRWIPMIGFNIQPSEFAKLGMLVFLADYLARRRDAMDEFLTIAKPLGVLVLMLFLLMLEPDFGTSVVLAIMVFVLFFLAGISWAWVLSLGGIGMLGMTLLIVLQPYRLTRITGFLDPWQHPFDSGYQLVQSLIAFGRGEIAGVGLGNSVQKLFYLPEAHTDFVFAVAAEEFGLLGVIFIILLFVLLVGAIFRIARERALIGDAFGAYVASGAAVLFGTQAFFNMGVNMGLMPTKGLTLPLVSYGGSSLVASCMLLGAVWQLGATASGATRTVRGRGMPRAPSQETVTA